MGGQKSFKMTCLQSTPLYRAVIQHFACLFFLRFILGIAEGNLNKLNKLNEW
jgi:hypothetical protein